MKFAILSTLIVAALAAPAPIMRCSALFARYVEALQGWQSQEACTHNEADSENHQRRRPLQRRQANLASPMARKKPTSRVILSAYPLPGWSSD